MLDVLPGVLLAGRVRAGHDVPARALRRHRRISTTAAPRRGDDFFAHQLRTHRRHRLAGAGPRSRSSAGWSAGSTTRSSIISPRGFRTRCIRRRRPVPARLRRARRDLPPPPERVVGPALARPLAAAHERADLTPISSGRRHSSQRSSMAASAFGPCDALNSARTVVAIGGTDGCRVMCRGGGVARWVFVVWRRSRLMLQPQRLMIQP